MRIIIDARSFNQGAPGTLLLGILNNLDYQKNEYTLIGDEKILKTLNLPCKIIHNTTKQNSFFGFIDRELANLINTYDGYFTPGYVIPRAIKINSYCVFHDMSCVDKKRVNHRWLLDFFKRFIFKRSYRIATKIFTVSHFSKERIENYFGTGKEIIVLNQGLSESVKASRLSPMEIKRQNYLVYVGSSKPHKNLKTLIKACEQINWQYPLHILVQKKNLHFRDQRILKQLAKNPNIVIKQNLSAQEHAKEISEAVALVNPSTYEGFGSSILESAYYGTPVIASDIPAFKENFADFNIHFFNPNDVNQLANILNQDHFLPIKIPDDFNKTHQMKTLTAKIENSFTTEHKDNKTTKNFIFSIVYQALVVLTPLITAPYVARVLGADNIGRFSFAYTLVCYFVIFSYLGFQQYAQRSIAEVQNDKEEQSRRFWQIVILRLITVVLSLGILFVLYAVNVFGEYSSLVLVFSILVGATAFDINFYFHGKEDFFIVMVINLFIRLVYLFCIFMFIRSTSDLPLYALLYSLMVIVGYLSMWVMLPENIKKVKLNGLNLKKHMVGALMLFLPVAAVSIYALLDKTLIGILVQGEQWFRRGYITVVVRCADVQNGYYFQAEKIVKALLSILLAFGAVMTTRNSIEYKNNHISEVKKNIYRSFRFVFAFGIPIALGTIVVAQSFVPLYFGDNYDGVAPLLMAYAPVILISGCSNILGAQYLLPTKQDKKYAISVGVGFAINLGFNCLLIPFMGAMGAVVGTLISELFIVLIQYGSVRNDFSLRYILINVWKYLVAGLVMCGCLICFYFFILKNSRTNNILDLIIIIPSGVGIYCLMLLVLKDRYVFKYTKAALLATGRFFRSATDRVIIQSTTFMMTVSANTHFNQITNREPTTYVRKKKEDKHEGKQ
ncbi:MAG: polysaccharide biosynthesis C-terminal domain-containing protein [Bacilli bacterium]|nr:polysaccharide biosynthesis C-terminal domain-containing protein [Bacilli bacterium]